MRGGCGGGAREEMVFRGATCCTAAVFGMTLRPLALYNVQEDRSIRAKRREDRGKRQRGREGREGEERRHTLIFTQIANALPKIPPTTPI
jgi:hypothetical protein